jgi:hypothetical protein
MYLQAAVARLGRGLPLASAMVDLHADEETAMPEITMPEVKLPDIKLPEGLRDMNKKDIQAALNDRLPKKVEVPDVDLSKVEIPKAVDERLKRVEKWVDSVDLSKTAAGKALDERIHPRRRPNPLLPIAALIAVLSAMAAAVWLITSPTATSRVRETADRTWRKVTGQNTDLMVRDDDADLASLLDASGDTELPSEGSPWQGTTSGFSSDLGGSPIADVPVASELDRPSGA